MLQELRGKLRHTLNLPVPNVTMTTTNDSVSMELERHISNYLCHASQRFETSQCVQVIVFKIQLTNGCCYFNVIFMSQFCLK